MRYYTRDLYMGDDDKKWEDANARYSAYLDHHSHSFTPSVNDLLNFSLHDAKVLGVECHGGSVVLLMDTTHAPMAKAKTQKFRLLFHDVVSTSGVDDLVGDIILYEEVFQIDESWYEFSALCVRSEFYVTCSDIACAWA